MNLIRKLGDLSSPSYWGPCFLPLSRHLLSSEHLHGGPQNSSVFIVVGRKETGQKPCALPVIIQVLIHILLPLHFTFTISQVIFCVNAKLITSRTCDEYLVFWLANVDQIFHILITSRRKSHLHCAVKVLEWKIYNCRHNASIAKVWGHCAENCFDLDFCGGVWMATVDTMYVSLGDH